MKIAIVHDWLVTYAGAEKVLEEIINVFPDSDLYSLIDFFPKEDRGIFHGKKIHTSFIQNLPFAKKIYRFYLPLMPIAIEQFDLGKYDLIISSSYAVAKGVITGPDQLHICMCYSPMRYAWDLQHQYLFESGHRSGIKSIFIRYILHKIRIWDVRTANGVDYFVAISNYIKRRIHKVYRRDSHVIYPPVFTSDFNMADNKKSFYLTSSRLVPYKKVDLIVKCFSKYFPDKKLIVIGDGPELEKIKKVAEKNVQLLGYQPFEYLKKYLSEAKAFIFAAEEDFGIAPIEAQASGTPVIAYGKGGALETVNGLGKSNNPTGVFFNEQTEESLKEAIDFFEKNIHSLKSEACVDNAKRFDRVNFRKQFSEYVKLKLSERGLNK